MSELRQPSPIEGSSRQAGYAHPAVRKNVAMHSTCVRKTCAIPVAGQVKPIPEAAGFRLPPPVSFILPLEREL
ncbi:hypothetical protein [Pararhizobium sp.]|uniref:hypothetical protein n=1 Tax=Pararhizobium sp. TaxID=1977563 RepID=UPI003D0F13B1